MAIGADITRTFSPLAHSLPQPPSTRFFQKWLEKKPQNNSPKSTLSFIVHCLGASELLKPSEVIWVEECWCPYAHKQPGLQIQLANAPVPNCSLATGGCRFPDIASRLCFSPAVLVGVPLPLRLWLGLVCRHLFPTAMGEFGELDLRQLQRAAS